ncbi:hypothetical protein [Acidovorax sp. FG27]|uniref:hypothetical protein n=1 Tax=Acidovorax sp. FG27 TaxID=3133652 RepID=UPI003342CDA1
MTQQNLNSRGNYSDAATGHGVTVTRLVAADKTRLSYPSAYDSRIRKALSRTKDGAIFSAFHPAVLEALKGEYMSGPQDWFAVCARFQAADGAVPLNDLDRAMRTLIPTTAAHDTSPNHSIVIGGAFAAAKAGDDRAPFAEPVLDAFVALQVFERGRLETLRRSFRRVNTQISLRDLDRAIDARFSALLNSEGPVGLSRLKAYQWLRPLTSPGELMSYWHPVHTQIH